MCPAPAWPACSDDESRTRTGPFQRCGLDDAAAHRPGAAPSPCNLVPGESATLPAPGRRVYAEFTALTYGGQSHGHPRVPD